MNKTLNKIKTEFHTTSRGIRQIDDFYVYKYENEYGVALDNINDSKINESFSSVEIKNVEINIGSGEIKKLLTLTTNLQTHKNEFASLCMQFVEKGENSENRELIINEPLKWWEKWKELIGNRMYNPAPYHVIAELLSLEILYKNNEKGIIWSGLIGSSIDLQSDNAKYEVKSSLVKYENEITISSQFQLDLDREDQPEYLIFFKMEKMENAETIDKVINRLKNYKSVIIEDIENKLHSFGYKEHSSTRNISYVVHEIRKYKIDNNFPRITKESFKGNKIPRNIKKITYTINLDNLEYEIL